ncbi:MAG TPA: DUF3108 domain-containing protein [Burkholderiaceae bacterium]
MHVKHRWVTAVPASRRLRRGAGVLVCVAAVLLAHAVLWWAVAPGVPPGGQRLVALQVRHLILPAPALVPEPALASLPTAAPPAAQAAAPSPPRAVRSREPPSAAGGAKAAEPREALAAQGEAMPDGLDALPPSATTAVPEAPPVATYPTRIPSSVQLSFALQRGAAAGEATLQWQVDAGSYVLQLQATLPQGRVVEQRSSGGFDQAGLAPLRLSDRRRGRDVRAANFQREHGKISFSGPRAQWPLHAGAQDRLSWLVQLVAIAGASPDAMHEGAELAMWVVGTRGAVNVWRFEVRGRQPLAAPGGAASAWWLVREPEHPYDLRVEVWLDPLRGHWPLRLRQTQVPGGEPLEWTLRDEPQAALGS